MTKATSRSAALLVLLALCGAGCDAHPPASDPAATEGAGAPAQSATPPEPEPIAPEPRTAELVLLPEACADVLGDPAQLIALSEAAWRDRNPELGYRYAALVRQLHPQSPEAAKAYELTAPALPHLYIRERSDPRSKWLTVEPVFMMEWLADIYAASGDGFPATEANLLLVGAPKSFRLQFEQYAKGHALLSRHPLRFKMENGLVEFVELAQ